MMEPAMTRSRNGTFSAAEGKGSSSCQVDAEGGDSAKFWSWALVKKSRPHFKNPSMA